MRLAVHDLGQLRERLQAVLRACLGDARVVALYLLRGRLLEPLLRDLVDVDARIPERQVAHRGEPSDPLPVHLPHRAVDRLARLVVEATVSAGDGETRHEPLHIPLERPGQRLVEVVDAENEPPVRRGEYAEVREMRVAAELCVQTGVRHPSQIRRHQVGGAPVERERGHEHAAVANRDELGHPRLRLFLEQLDRVGPVPMSVPTRRAPCAAPPPVPPSPALHAPPR